MKPPKSKFHKPKENISHYIELKLMTDIIYVWGKVWGSVRSVRIHGETEPVGDKWMDGYVGR